MSRKRERECVALGSADLDHLGHVALGPRVLRGVLDTHQHQEVQVVPHAVLRLDVLLERHRLVVELVPLQSCRRQRYILVRRRSQMLRPVSTPTDRTSAVILLIDRQQCDVFTGW